MSDSSRTQILTRLESAFAEVPPSNATTAKLRFSSESLDHKSATVISDEIRSDRQRSDLILVGYDAGGDINQEVIYGGSIETWLQAALCGTWAATDETMSVTTTNSSPGIVRASGTKTFNQSWVGKTVTGTGIPGGATILSVQDATHATLSANATASGTITMTIVGLYGTLRNGVTNRSYNLEKGFLDIGKYLDIRGAVLNQFSLDISSRKQLTMATSWMAAQGYIASTSIAGSTTPTAAVTGDPMRAGDLISLQDSGGSNTEVDGEKVKRITLQIQNNLRLHELATAYQTDDLGRGVMNITGTLETYLTGSAIYAALKANTPISIRFLITSPNIVGGTDGLGMANTYQVTIPKAKLSTAPTPIGGVDSDVMQVVGWQALLDDGVGYTIDIVRGLIV